MSFIDSEVMSTAYVWGLSLLAAAALTLLARHARSFVKTASKPLQFSIRGSNSDKSLKDTHYNIEPLNDFDLNAEEPIKARPFKPKYHMTMALENATFSSLLTMDKSYPTCIQLRRTLLRTQHHEVIGLNPKSAPAISELYTWLTATYLPSRFPTLFQASATGLVNTTTHETLPLTPNSATHALDLVAAHIDTDFLFLLPSAAPEDEGKYRLEAFATCFPSGFRTRSKLGMLLSDIHGPVPHYKEKLERSMDRFFSSLGVGRVVRRWNWTVSTTGDLFCLSGNHASSEEVERGEVAEEDVDLRTTVLRCERQTLHRLPGSGAVVFAFKTFQYPIGEMRDEGSGEALCEAIDGMGGGSAPGMVVYKRQVVWGEKVKAFLRGEIEVDG